MASWTSMDILAGIATLRVVTTRPRGVTSASPSQVIDKYLISEP